MFDSEVVFCRITLGPHVDQLATRMLPLADSLIMMQLCRHYWEVKNHQQCYWLLVTSTISSQAGHHTVKLHLRRITCAADVMQNASTRDLQGHALSDVNTFWHSPVYGRSRLTHAVSERLLTLAQVKRPEATGVIGLSYYALQRHTRITIHG